MADLPISSDEGALQVEIIQASNNNKLAVDANGNIGVHGDVASGATDSGNPVKVGGVFTTALPTLTTGQRGNLQMDSSARIIIAPLTNTSVVKAQLQDNAGTAITVGQKVMASSVPVVIASDQSDLAVDPATVYSGFQPALNNFDTGVASTEALDASGRLEIHGSIMSDEGGFRDDFSGSSITTALTGTVTFTNGSTAVVGVGTAFTTQVNILQYLKKSTDAETLYQNVNFVNNDTSLTLAAPYAGTTATVAAVVSNYKTSTPTGGSITVATSVATIASGTVSGNVASLTRVGDYLPLTLQWYGTISQRIANQTAVIGFVSPITGALVQVQFTGTVNTTINFVSGFSSASADQQTTAVTLANGGTTATSHVYKMDISANQATLSIDGTVVATNTLHVPGPYDIVNLVSSITNTGTAASSTSLACDYMYFADWDRIQTDNDFIGEPQRIQLSDPTAAYVANVTPSGSVQVSEVLSSKSLYSAIFSGIVIGATPTDMITVTGSATKTIRITRMEISPSTTGNSTSTYFILTRSTLNTVGTSTTLTNIAHDTSNAASTAVAKAYTANPTAGTAIGNIRATRIFTGALGSAGFLPYLFDFTNGGVDQGIVLRGANASMAFNFGGAANPGGLNLTGWVEWVEE